MQNEWIEALLNSFEEHRNSTIAAGQQAYMRHRFAFIGIKTPLRRQLLKPFFCKDNLPAHSDVASVVESLWQRDEREYQYTAQELVYKYHKQFKTFDISMMEYMAVHKSWWDSIDMIATKLMGAYFMRYPTQRHQYSKKWLSSGNMWLQRCALLFQLKYKEHTDTALLNDNIQALLGSQEFFINKAIGWVLREYGKTNPQWVLDFVNKYELSPLSYREGTRLLPKPEHV